MTSSRGAGASHREPVPGDLRATAWLGSIALCVAFLPALLQVSWWPLTNVYMYSAYFRSSPEIRAGYALEEYDRIESVQRIARELVAHKLHKEATEYLCYRTCIRLARDDGEALYLFDSLGVADWKQWLLTVAGPVLIEDLAEKPLGCIEFDPQRPDYPAQSFLSSYVHVLQDHLPREVWTKFERLEMAYLTFNTSTRDDGSQLPSELWEHSDLELKKSEATLVCLASVPLP